jgi:hypothetical protein
MAGCIETANISQLPENFQEVVQRQLRRQRQVEHICRTARLVFELLNELDRYHGLGDDLDRRLARYAAIDHEILRALGGDRFPSMPLRTMASTP